MTGLPLGLNRGAVLATGEKLKNVGIMNPESEFCRFSQAESHRHLILWFLPGTYHSPLSSMRTLLDPYWATVAIAAIAHFAVFVRRLYRRVRNDEITRAFVQDMATNHLPHIYDRLERLCDQQGIERTAAPPIRWLDLNGKSRD